MQVLDLDAYFFHDFAMDGLFNRFSHLGKAGDKSSPRIFPAGVGRYEKLISVAHGNDDSRADARINHRMAMTAVHHAFSIAVSHRTAALAAEAMIAVPVVQRQTGHAAKA